MNHDKIQQLSDDMMPKKIKAGQVKKFKLIRAGEIDPMTNEVSYNSGATFEGVSTVFDTKKGETVIIRNITGKRNTRDANGKDVVEEITSPVSFDASGMVYVDHTQPETYVFLSRDNRCGTNPFRDRSVPVIWEEIIEVNVKERTQFINNVRYEAMTFCRNPDPKKIIAAAKVLLEKKLIDVNLSGSIQDIRWELEKLCDSNPSEIIRASREELPILKLDIQDAVKYGEIEFQQETNSWVFPKLYGDAALIYKSPVGENALESLAKYLIEEKESMKKKKAEERTETMYDKIKDTLKQLSVEA
jgi:hypothetical protein